MVFLNENLVLSEALGKQEHEAIYLKLLALEIIAEREVSLRHAPQVVAVQIRVHLYLVNSESIEIIGNPTLTCLSHFLSLVDHFLNITLELFAEFALGLPVFLGVLLSDLDYDDWLHHIQHNQPYFVVDLCTDKIIFLVYALYLEALIHLPVLILLIMLYQ